MKNMTDSRVTTRVMLNFFLLLLSGNLFATEYDGSTPLNNPYNEDGFLAACRTGNLEAVEFFSNHENFDPDRLGISGKSGKKVKWTFVGCS